MPSPSTQTTYFGYGSNLWLHQMCTRCPTSTYLGVARLKNYKWIINDRGYANVVELDSTSTTPDYSEVVFGLVYALGKKDEERLDRNEGVPIAYTKEDLECDFWKAEHGTDSKVDTTKKPTETKEMLTMRYIDRKRVTEDEPKKEYIYRMNKGIEDAIKMGVPHNYVKKVMRKFIPKEGEEKARKSLEEKALRQADEFVDESGIY
ncbi:hypothetical protein P280DRAFT_457933 [Massarina eburnea CBS 473.64]|uniref:gamma-glutamylcyclotransferase n=1 Tax=Massarina eburnea CBS 473.64 TaxID=1395130 RepID=A0A6A6RSX3_9PLEO|nr:hypothetical protein P280DRAFT_457933 [Massarina eburnea CBS 473.64]